VIRYLRKGLALLTDVVLLGTALEQQSSANKSTAKIYLTTVVCVYYASKQCRDHAVYCFGARTAELDTLLLILPLAKMINSRANVDNDTNGEYDSKTPSGGIAAK
jgi:hypothetical protein